MQIADNIFMVYMKTKNQHSLYSSLSTSPADLSNVMLLYSLHENKLSPKHMSLVFR